MGVGDIGGLGWDWVGGGYWDGFRGKGWGLVGVMELGMVCNA